jgi:hypothetical protein
MNKIVEIKFGSHLYGTNTPNSDLDIKGIYLPTAREIVLGTYRKTIATSRPKADCERNTKDDVDSEYFSLDRYLQFLMEGQTLALDMLFTPESNLLPLADGDHSSWVFRAIRDNKDRLITKNVNAFVGYSRQQAARYGIKGSRMDALKRTKDLLDLFYYQDKLSDHAVELEALVDRNNDLISLEKTPLIEIVMLKGPKGLIDQPHLKVNGRAFPFHATVKYVKEIVDKMFHNYGLRAHKAHLDGSKDYKALSHSVRVNNEAIELLTTGHITFPRPDRELLLKIKLRELPYEQVAEMIEQGLEDLYVANEKSMLREEPDKEWANNFVYEVYSQIVKEST